MLHRSRSINRGSYDGPNDGSKILIHPPEKSELPSIIELALFFAIMFLSNHERQRGRALGDEIRVPSLKRYFLQDYGSFLANGQVNYGAAALLTYYFAHMDGDGAAVRLKAFLTTL